MFGIKGRDTFNRPRSNVERFLLWIRQKWAKIFPFVLLSVFLVLSTIAGYMWYIYLHTKELTGAEKTLYINEKKAEATFRQEKFDKLKEEIQKRRDQFNAEGGSHVDVFYK